MINLRVDFSLYEIHQLVIQWTVDSKLVFCLVKQPAFKFSTGGNCDMGCSKFATVDK